MRLLGHLSICNDPRAMSEEPIISPFVNPPINELALAVQFEPQTVDYMQTAKYRERVKEDFPQREEQIARPPIGESFTAPAPGLPIHIGMIEMPTMPRFWFLSEDEAELVQLQHDLLAFNWRRRSAGAAYPGYGACRSNLQRLLAELESVLAEDEDRPRTLTPNWCEVTYINQVEPEAGADARPPLSKVLRGIEVPPTDGFLPEMEEGQIGLRFLIPGTDGPRGRLTATTASAVRNETQVPIWVITITTKTLAQGDGIDAALEALDSGHEWCAKSFIELTSEEMHERWQTAGGPK